MRYPRLRPALAGLVLALASACAGPPTGSAPAPAPERTPIYRYINVTGGEVRFGTRIEAGRIAIRLDDSTYAMRPGTFGGGGTRRILVRVDSNRIVRAMTFVYDGSEDFATKESFYTAQFGPPRRRPAPGGGEVLTWTDTETHFELHWEPGGTPPFWSWLVDLLPTDPSSP